ncbi:hypothetical protein [Actinophytocola sp.]|uniref:hypothetical protein n=1 Tax=Actinophytocola sp. TaxID=1872138 RepID=UPI003D6C2565
MSDRPEDVDAAFAAIVADLEREGVGAQLPELDEPAGDLATEETEPATPPAAAPPTPAAWRGHEGDWDWSWSADDEHYVPPEPPPLPRLRPLTVVALILILAAVVLLVLPGVIGLDARVGTPIALLALTCGGGMLLLRIRQNPKEPDDGRDDGAQI